MPCPFCEPSGFEKRVIEIIETFDERGAHLTKQEARCLAALMEKKGIVTKEALISAMWYDDPDGGPLSAEAHMKVVIYKIRAKIKKNDMPWTIRPVFGVGYVLIIEDEGRALKVLATNLTATLLVGQSIMHWLS